MSDPLCVSTSGLGLDVDRVRILCRTQFGQKHAYGYTDEPKMAISDRIIRILLIVHAYQASILISRVKVVKNFAMSVGRLVVSST
jgi:hypothetical protein